MATLFDPKEKIIYESLTGALVSQHDYNFLSDSQKAQCKIYMVIKNPLNLNKPLNNYKY